MSMLFPSRHQWRAWSLPSKLSAISCYLTIVATILTVVSLGWPSSPQGDDAHPERNRATPPKAHINVYCAFFRTRLLDTIVNDRALLLEVTEDLKHDCLDEPFAAWVKPARNAQVRVRDDVGVRFIIKNVGDATATTLRMSVDPWHDLPPANIVTSPNIEAAVLSHINSRGDTFDVIAIPRLLPRTTAVVTYTVSLPTKRASRSRSYAFPVSVMSSEDAALLKMFVVSTSWADAAESAVTNRPVTYPISMVTPVSYEELHGDTARALVPIKRPPCAAMSSVTSKAVGH